MKKSVYIVKSINVYNGVTRVDNLFAETTENNAIRDVERLRERADKQKSFWLEDETVDYCYEVIHLYD